MRSEIDDICTILENLDEDIRYLCVFHNTNTDELAYANTRVKELNEKPFEEIAEYLDEPEFKAYAYALFFSLIQHETNKTVLEPMIDYFELLKQSL